VYPKGYLMVLTLCESHRRRGPFNDMGVERDPAERHLVDAFSHTPFRWGGAHRGRWRRARARGQIPLLRCEVEGFLITAILRPVAGGEHAENVFHGKPVASNNRFSAEEVWVNGDPLQESILRHLLVPITAAPAGAMWYQRVRLGVSAGGVQARPGSVSGRTG
jgi:hypothetical protein